MTNVKVSLVFILVVIIVTTWLLLLVVLQRLVQTKLAGHRPRLCKQPLAAQRLHIRPQGVQGDLFVVVVDDGGVVVFLPSPFPPSSITNFSIAQTIHVLHKLAALFVVKEGESIHRKHCTVHTGTYVNCTYVNPFWRNIAQCTHNWNKNAVHTTYVQYVNYTYINPFTGNIAQCTHKWDKYVNYTYVNPFWRIAQCTLGQEYSIYIQYVIYTYVNPFWGNIAQCTHNSNKYVNYTYVLVLEHMSIHSQEGSKSLDI